MEIQTKTNEVIRNTGSLNVRYFETEQGKIIPSIRIFYHSWGALNTNANNVIWICHGLTADSNAEAWWPGLIGPGKTFDTNKYFIICPNTPGSCYGSSTPEELKAGANMSDKEKLNLSVRDIACIYNQMAKQLSFNKIEILAGPSIGGFLALEWGIEHTIPITKLVLVASSYYASPWNIAINETQRMALKTKDKASGLAAARAIAMLSYRSGEAYNRTQKGQNEDGQFYAATYQQYQGEKLVKRFSSETYEFMIDLFNSHDISRKRGNVKAILEKTETATLIIGFSHDQLFPSDEQYRLANMLPKSTYHLVESDFGHDAFLTESRTVAQLIKNNLNL